MCKEQHRTLGYGLRPRDACSDRPGSTFPLLAVIGHLRGQRVAMVQSIEQLEFIYLMLLNSCNAFAAAARAPT